MSHEKESLMPENQDADLSALMQRWVSEQNEFESRAEARALVITSLEDARNVLQGGNEKTYATIYKRILSGEIMGDAPNFHNISIDYSRNNQPERAVKICEVGIKHWPNNVDLNADALRYAMDSGDYVCATTFAQSFLSNCPNREKWNWRGFSFLFDYYIKVQPDDYELELEHLVADYKRILPLEEKAYLCDAERYEKKGDTGAMISCLKDAIAQLNAPQCAMKLTDIYFNQANYEEAIRTATMGIAYAAEPQPSIRTAYLLLIRALSKDALFLKSGSTSVEDATQILNEYALAKKYVSPPEKSIINLRMDIVSTFAGLSNPD